MRKNATLFKSRTAGCFTSLLLMFLFLLALNGCATMGGEPLSLRDTGVDKVWPPAPNPPRIRFLREIKGPDQVMPEQGRMQKVWEIVTGESRPNFAFQTPYGITTNGGSVVYVADNSARVVHRYDLANREVSYITQAGEELFASPTGVAVDSQGNLYVSDAVNAKVYVFSKDGKFLRELKGEFKRPAGIAINSRGEKFIVDVLAHKLKMYDGNDRFLRDFPNESDSDKLGLPSNVAIDRNDNVYVTDSMNFTVKTYDREGNLRTSIGEIGDSPGSFARPKGVAVDSDLNIYTIDASFDNFQIFDQTGRLLLFVGKSGRGIGEFFLPSGIFIDKNDVIYISDTYNRRIQILQYLKEGEKK